MLAINCRISLTLTAAMALAIISPLAGQEFAGLDGASGHIYKVDLAGRSFELLKETEYDPKSDIGQSRFTVYWDDSTRVVETEERKDFAGIAGPVTALFQGIRPADQKALEEGKPFEARVVDLFMDPSLAPPRIEGVELVPNQVQGRFTPIAGKLRTGMIEVAGKSVEVRLRKQHWRIWVKHLHPHKVLADGFWQTTLHGQTVDGRFVAKVIEITKRPNPRLTDDPKLPRVLVIGDSISMNYDQTAKEALKGVANYHRCEGNAFSSSHGVRNSELWMGDYKEPGGQWDVIQFNHGLHDLKQAYDKDTDVFGAYAVSLEDYQANLEKMIAILKQSGAKLIWCSTTPVPNDNKGTYARRKGAAKEFNEAAMKVMRRHPEILVNDLYSLIDGSPLFDAWRKTADVHFYKDEEKKALGEAVAGVIRKALAEKAR